MTAISALAYFPKGIPPFQKKKKSVVFVKWNC